MSKNVVNLIRKVLLLIFIYFFNNSLTSQNFFVPSDTLHAKRFNLALGFAATTYAGFSIGLYNVWYKKFDQGPFKLFNDWGEWEHMDKGGHIHSAYFQGVLCYKGARWAGMSDNKSILTGLVAGMLFQSTIEIMDGFSTKWGFSLPDISANIVGTTIFATQQYYWNDQKISIKVSSIPIRYPDDKIVSDDGTMSSSLSIRARSLYGDSYLERFLKDYNAQTYWASFNVHSFLPKDNKWPKWLNVSLGYGAENMFGGYDNQWTENGVTFVADPILYPRKRQFFIGFDLDFPKLKPHNPFLKTICSVINIFKVPSPALEINTEGQIKFHILR